MATLETEYTTSSICADDFGPKKCAVLALNTGMPVLVTVNRPFLIDRNLIPLRGRLSFPPHLSLIIMGTLRTHPRRELPMVVHQIYHRTTVIRPQRLRSHRDREMAPPRGIRIPTQARDQSGKSPGRVRKVVSQNAYILRLPFWFFVSLLLDLTYLHCMRHWLMLTFSLSTRTFFLTLQSSHSRPLLPVLWTYCHRSWLQADGLALCSPHNNFVSDPPCRLYEFEVHSRAIHRCPQVSLRLSFSGRHHV